MGEVREIGTVPEWVAAVAASERKRVPVGEVSGWCRTPHPKNMGRHRAREGQTLADIAAEAFPMRCLACWTEHRITGLRSAQQAATGVEPAVDPEDVGEVAKDPLDHAPCPACGTVGLWPAVRPEKELRWANEGLVDTYGWWSRLPEGQEVLVPELCGHECVQVNDKGPTNVFCCQGPKGTKRVCQKCAEEGNTAAHIGRKSDRAREVAVANATKAIRLERRPVDLDAAAQALAEADDAATVAEAAPVSEEAEVDAEHSEPLTAPLAGESRPGGVSVPAKDSAGLAAAAALMAQLSAVEQSPVGIPAGAAGGDAYTRAWSSLKAGVQTLAEVVKHTGNAEAAMEALGAQRAEFQARAERAEAAAGEVEEKLATVRANAEAEVLAAREQAETAKQGQLSAEARADTLERQLAALQERYDDLLGAAGAGGLRQMIEDTLDARGVRSAAGRGARRLRPSPAQKKMLALIAENRPDAVVVGRVVDAGSPGNSSWYVEGHPAADGHLKTLKSLQRNGLVTWGEFNAEGVAAAVLTVPGEDAIGVRADKAAPEAAVAPERAAEAESGVSAAVPAQSSKMLRPWYETGGEPPEEAVESYRARLRAGRIARGEVPGPEGRPVQVWLVSGAKENRVDRETLNWMLGKGLMGVEENGTAYVLEF